jgi:hypothetical protein
MLFQGTHNHTINTEVTEHVQYRIATTHDLITVHSLRRSVNQVAKKEGIWTFLPIGKSGVPSGILLGG